MGVSWRICLSVDEDEEGGVRPSILRFSNELRSSGQS